MIKQKSFFDKITTFVLGETGPMLTEHDLQMIRNMDQKLEQITKLLNSSQPKIQPTNGRELSDADQAPGDFNDLTEQVRKLAKTQFKANTLQESQLTQHQETLKSLQKSIDQQEKLFDEFSKQCEQAVSAAQLELLKSILPVLDSLDAAFGSGRRQVLQLPMSREVRQAVIAWLDGIRLARMRLLDLLAAYDIRPIPTVGQPFDPHYHIAVATDTAGQAADGIIVSEDRPGYARSTKVLREAQVVVARSK